MHSCGAGPKRSEKTAMSGQGSGVIADKQYSMPGIKKKRVFF